MSKSEKQGVGSTKLFMKIIKYIPLLLFALYSCSGNNTEQMENDLAQSNIGTTLPKSSEPLTIDDNTKAFIKLDAYNGNCEFEKKEATERLYNQMVKSSSVIYIFYKEELTIDQNCWGKVMGSNFGQGDIVNDGDSLTLIIGAKYTANEHASDQVTDNSSEINENLCDDITLQSANYLGCSSTVSLIEREKLDIEGLGIITDIVPFKNSLYVVEKYPGKVLKVNKRLDQYSIWLDLSDDVYCAPSDGGECGIWSVSFHPTKKYFLISYLASENTAVIEKIYLDDNDNPNMNTRETLFFDQRDTNVHYSGQLEFSAYLSGFVYTSGDGFRDIGSAAETTSTRGKILLIPDEDSVSLPTPPTISRQFSTKPITNIIAYGFRNPWGLAVWNKFIIIPDVGQYTIEEINIINMEQNISKESVNFFGWPIFEGLINQYGEFNTTGIDWLPNSRYFIYENGNVSEATNYLLSNSEEPVFWYKHGEGPFGTRVAVIGGGVVQYGVWKDFYIFADHYSNEIFFMDLINNTVFSIRNDFEYGFITNISTDNTEPDTIYIGTYDGAIIKYQVHSD